MQKAYANRPRLDEMELEETEGTEPSDPKNGATKSTEETENGWSGTTQLVAHAGVSGILCVRRFFVFLPQ